MKFEKIEDIIAWQKARDLTLAIYSSLKDCKDYSFRDQIQRAVISIMNNTAEGYERKGNKEFKQFLFVAKGSCGEVRSMLHLCLALNYIDKVKFTQLYEDSIAIARMLSGLIKTL